MPLYEYTCQTCLNCFERLKPVSQMDDDAPCPDCGSASQRQLSVFASFSAGSDGEVSAIAGGGGGCCGGGGGGVGCACSMTT
jgi:putative FmdB family regulatory protein